MSAFLSGEMKDTVQLHPAGAYGQSLSPLALVLTIRTIKDESISLKAVLEQFFSRKERQSLFRSWAGSASLWIKVYASVPYLSMIHHKYQFADTSPCLTGR